ncbi:hypothetical protein HaLaN_08363, partial [Haematococcus lacustris]
MRVATLLAGAIIARRRKRRRSQWRVGARVGVPANVSCGGWSACGRVHADVHVNVTCGVHVDQFFFFQNSQADAGHEGSRTITWLVTQLAPTGNEKQ